MSTIDIQRYYGYEDAMEILDHYELGHIELQRDTMPIVVFDIDDTLIDSKTGNIIHTMMHLYQRILDMGIPIYLVTARPPQYRKETLLELQKNNITGYKHLYMVDNYVQRDDKAMRKAKVRRYLEDEGYEILLNIGDDPGDMLYGHYVYGIKLPYLY